MTDPRQALHGRSLSEVTEALSRVRDAALDRALDPRNVAKGHWRDANVLDLFDILDGEVDELVEAVWDDEPLDRVLAEAGDVVWTVAMIVDWRFRREASTAPTAEDPTPPESEPRPGR